MLTLVPQDEAGEARELLRLVAPWRPDRWALLLLLLLGACLFALDCPEPGGLLVGSAIALILSRRGPAWWPGRR